MTISTAPTVPNPTSASFAADAYAFTQWMATAGAEMNTEIARINALGYGSYSATSTTNLTFATGSQSLTVDAGKGFVTGQPLMIAQTATPTNNMVGTVTSYDSGTGALVVNVTSKNGSGSASAWTVSVGATVVGGGVSPDSIVVLESGTSWTCPAGVTKAVLRVQGAGGGGGASNASTVTGGFGAGGGTAVAVIALTPGAAYSYAIGAGGAGGPVGTNGSAGSATTFTANGVTYTGGGGNGGPYSGAFPAGGTASNGQINIAGSPNGATSTGYGCGGKPGDTNTGSSTAGAAGMAGAVILELYK